MQLSQILCFLTDAKKSGAIFLGMDVCGEQKVSPEGFHLDEENGANLNSSTNEKIKFYQKDLTFRFSVSKYMHRVKNLIKNQKK